MQPIKGFTIIELIMVVVLLGMISVFAIPNYTKAVRKTYVKTAVNNLLIISSAQRIKQAGGDQFQACADVNACNANLNISIIPQGLTYLCNIGGGNPPTTFSCDAQQGANFTVRITNAAAACCVTAAATCYGVVNGC